MQANKAVHLVRLAIASSSSSSQPVGFFVRWQFQRRQGQLTLYTTITQLPCHFFSQQAPPTFTLLPSRQRSFPSKSFRDDFIFLWWTFFKKEIRNDDGSWEREKKKFSPKKCRSSRVHVRVWTKPLVLFSLAWKRRKGRRRGDTCGTVKVIRISCISTSNHPPLLLPTFRPGKNGRRMQEEYRGERLEKEV